MQPIAELCVADLDLSRAAARGGEAARAGRRSKNEYHSGSGSDFSRLTFFFPRDLCDFRSDLENEPHKAHVAAGPSVRRR